MSSNSCDSCTHSRDELSVPSTNSVQTSLALLNDSGRFDFLPFEVFESFSPLTDLAKLLEVHKLPTYVTDEWR